MVYIMNWMKRKFKWEDENVERLSKFWKFSLSVWNLLEIFRTWKRFFVYECEFLKNLLINEDQFIP